jgi:hypothetical protein
LKINHLATLLPIDVRRKRATEKQKQKRKLISLAAFTLRRFHFGQQYSTSGDAISALSVLWFMKTAEKLTEFTHSK